MRIAPLRNAVLVVIAVIVVAGVGFAGYLIGRGQLGGCDGDSGLHRKMRRRSSAWSNSSASSRISNSARWSTCDANESLRQTIKSLRDELSASQEEVLFYRQLMAPSEAQRGLRVEKLELSSGASPTEVKYRLLLTQVSDKNDWASGTVTVDIVGTSANEQVVLPLTEMTQVETYPLALQVPLLPGLHRNVGDPGRIET